MLRYKGEIHAGSSQLGRLSKVGPCLCKALVTKSYLVDGRVRKVCTVHSVGGVVNVERGHDLRAFSAQGGRQGVVLGRR